MREGCAQEKEGPNEEKIYPKLRCQPAFNQLELGDKGHVTESVQVPNAGVRRAGNPKEVALSLKETSGLKAYMTPRETGQPRNQ